MRVISDILTDYKFFGILIEDRQNEEERIVQIENIDGNLIIYLNDKKNTSISIASEDLNAVM